MENLLFLLATSFVMRIRKPRKISSHYIGNTGCSVLFESGRSFTHLQTPSGDELFFNESYRKGVTYGVICINMQERIGLKKAEGLLKDYMNKLKGPFFIFHSLGIVNSPNWDREDVITLEDYWQDAVGVDGKVKAYTDGKILAVLYVKNINVLSVEKQDLFLDSFHFGDACKNQEFSNQ